ncbi:unnamed protein product [Adineta steineri]|uniref:Uncharacterized protein n=2 Tax=Adineta steineri TaxID=433720 RepID=A0A819ANI3_9BILA|nr:unnamed protein product [Adineta steineri]CAF3784831.1 unnamed protein product [Adineta steineri]
MATANTSVDVKKILLFWPKSIRNNDQHSPFISFDKCSELINYVCQNLGQTDTFDLHIPGENLKEILEDPISKSNQIRICAYYDNNDTLERDQNRFQFKHNKLQFYLERDLEKQLQNTETSIAVSSSRSIDREAINNITMSAMERLQSKRSNSSHCDPLVPKKIHSTAQSDSRMKNMEEIDSRFICASCKLVLCEPYQLTCGHRLCKSCIHTHNNCAICLEVGESDKQISGNDLSQHYLSETHQRNLLSYITLKFSINDNSGRLSNQIVNGHSISSNVADVLKHHLEQIERSILPVQSNIEFLKKKFSFLERLQATVNDIAHKTIKQNSSNQKISTTSYTKNGQLSNDDSYIWRITGVKEKTMDAVAERQMSIYSEPFYTSPTGYKMCLRLYLNGDGNARGTHLSLFLVIMRSEYDAIIHWPFKYKVKFTLLNQLQSDSPSKCFWPDVNSTCFQRPRTNMNIPSGIPKFFPLVIFKQTYDEYVQNDTMFIKVEVDFISERPKLVFIPGVSELANDEKHADIIHENIERMVSLR